MTSAVTQMWWQAIRRQTKSCRMLYRVSSLHSAERLKQCVCSRGGCRLVSVSAFRLYAAAAMGWVFQWAGFRLFLDRLPLHSCLQRGRSLCWFSVRCRLGIRETSHVENLLGCVRYFPEGSRSHNRFFF